MRLDGIWQVWKLIKNTELQTTLSIYHLVATLDDRIKFEIENTDKVKYVTCQDRWWWTLFYFLFSFLFYFSCLFSFNFLFLEQLRLGFISHAVTSVTKWWRSHKTDHETWEKEVEGSGTKWRHTTWTPHVGLMYYSWSFRVGCTVVSTDHGD